MSLKHPEYAHGISDEELIKEALEFCDEELDGYDGIEYDDECEVACQRSNTFIRELVRRLEKTCDAALMRKTSEGWKLVPQEPTQEMLERGADSCCSLTVHGAYGVYISMLSASPDSKRGDK